MAQLPALDELIACPSCDALYLERDVAPGETASCLRCHAVLEAPRRTAMTRIIMLALAAIILMVAAIFFPFLELEVAGRAHRASLLDTVRAFSSGLTAPLTVAMAALIVILPLTRFGAILYTLVPMAFGNRRGRMRKAPFAWPRRCGPGRWPRCSSSAWRWRWSRWPGWPI